MKISYQLCTVLFFFLLASGHAVARQHTELKGSVEDVDGVALPFANVSVLEKEGGRMVVGAVSDENGDFLISTSKTGEVILSISSIGYKTYQTSPFTLESGMKKDFGTIQVEEEATSLDAVEVRSSRPEVIIEADRTVVNVEGTVMAEGSTALDVVGRSPGVYVDADGNINLNGRSGVIVLIDDRQTYMSAKDLANFLRAMPADNIKSIEVINNPPAKYDAEGAAGVLNIQLKKNDYNGMNGSIQAGHYYNGRHAPFAGGSLNLKRGKWTTNLSLNYNTWVRDIDLQILRRFKEENGTSEFDQDALLQLGEENFFLSGGADYQINTKHSVGFSFQASDRDGEENGDSRTDISNPDNPDINHLQALNDSESGNTRVFTNFHYVGNLDTLGTKLSADVDYTVDRKSVV